MAAARSRRVRVFPLLRALWRYRGRVVAHGDVYQEEVAVCVRTVLSSTSLGVLALKAYRAAMRTMLVVAIASAVLTVVVFAVCWHIDHLLALLAIAPGALALWAAIWRFSWGAPLDWLDEHDDPTRTIAPAELPGRLRALAAETRKLSDVPGNISAELDQLAGDVEAESGPHVVR